jgi:hypothetical protein
MQLRTVLILNNCGHEILKYWDTIIDTLHCLQLYHTIQPMNRTWDQEFDAILHAHAHLQYCILVLAGEEYAYAYDAITDTVQTAEFPDVPVHRLYTRCGHVLHHADICMLVKAKLGILSHCELAASFS